MPEFTPIEELGEGHHLTLLPSLQGSKLCEKGKMSLGAGQT